MADPPINIHIHSTLSRRQRAQLAKAFEKGEPVTTALVKAAPAKPGWQTTEFWITVLATVGAVAASAQGSLPHSTAAYASIVSIVAYAISRGLAKH